MHYLDYNEQIQHRTGDFPLAYYPVDQRHPRYRMPMHWHREVELLRVLRGRLRLYVDDAVVELAAGEMLLLREGTLHGVVHVGRLEGAVAKIPDAVPQLVSA